MNNRRIVAVVLATVWSLCLLHCLADKASAHWHLETGSPAHHHHPFSQSHEHDSNGSQQEHSHQQEVGECCEVKARLSTAAHLEKVNLKQLHFAGAYLHKLILLTFSDRIVLETKATIFNDSSSGQLLYQIHSLRIPNAPPATVIS